MSKKPIKKPNYKYIALKFADENIELVYIDYTKDTEVIMQSLVDLFKKELGEKFTEVHEVELREHFVSQIERLNSSEISCSYGSYQRLSLSNSTDIMPWVTIEKCEKKTAL